MDTKRLIELSLEIQGKMDGRSLKAKKPQSVRPEKEFNPILEVLNVFSGVHIEYGWNGFLFGTNPVEADEVGRCEYCRACGHWGDEIWCFSEAVIMGRAERPKPIDEAREKCPKQKEGKK